MNLKPKYNQCSPLRLGQNQKPAAKNEKNCLYLLNEKTERIKCPKSGIFTNNYWVGQSNFAS